MGFAKRFASLSHQLLFPLSLLQEPPSIEPGEETLQKNTPKDPQIFYINPLYDAGKMET